ncbi:FCD domain-containing protein [Microbacterium invictum]|uniref:DNA-binding GntR family transcriptional regulator n=1 Tax=Microbacterium invictum TaxID=515415 RepID=A0AA40SPG8_9MICO|nr:DNA-binding GntR family transcriptional regulator [Microbacterium invictum]
MVQLDVQPVEARLSIRESVERALSALVVSGELAPGTLVSVPTLAAQFDVSATPVREAMLELERRGFVEAVKNKGFRVTEVSDEELAHIVEVRQLLEPPAMERLATQFPQDRLEELTASANDIIAGAEGGDLRTYLEADVAFHLGLTAMLGNPLLVQMVSDLRSRTRLIGLTALLESGRLTDSAAEHLDLLRALSTGDAAGARRVMSHHISHVLGVWSGHPEDSADPVAAS